MVFPTIPVYIDPRNWQQQADLQQGSDSDRNPQLPPLSSALHVGGGVGSFRPCSMADRARLAKLPQPDAAQKCPRCESTNTKFCYFNNYSLSQPRHFCKTCRRYWTRGGALRNVPVGGGCRRNKKSKSSSSKYPAATEKQAGSNSTSAIPLGCTTEILGPLPQPPPQLPFLASSQDLTHQYGTGNFGLNFGGIQAQIGATSGASQTDMGFHTGSSSGRSSATFRGQQFPFLAANFDAPTSLYSFQSEGLQAPSSIFGLGDSQLRSVIPSSRVTPLAPVKMEENQGLNLSRQFLGISENNQWWGGNIWTDLSGFNSSSTSHL